MTERYIAENKLPESKVNLLTKASDDFYMYNVSVDRGLIRMYGVRPRYFFGDDCNEDALQNAEDFALQKG